MRHAFTALAVVLLLAAAPARPAERAKGGRRPIADRELGLAKGSVFDVPTPPLYRAEDSTPGEKPLPARPTPVAPPVVPHAVADFLPITGSENACLACHELPGPKKPGEPTPIPPSHRVDLRREPGKTGEKLAGARWVCISCHTPRTDARPLVGSR